jgi:hypothetical protein
VYAPCPQGSLQAHLQTVGHLMKQRSRDRRFLLRRLDYSAEQFIQAMVIER